jgi:putative molybdopterin biosynthesis protein
VHDANATLVAHSVREMGAEATVLGIARDDAGEIGALLDRALDTYDLTLLSGGTSKGAGDLCHRAVAERAVIAAHGIALKPGKPLCLAAREGRGVAVLPGFPTSAVFTFHAFVAPVIRALMGLAEDEAPSVRARVPLGLRSDPGRREFTLVNLVPGRGGLVAFPLGKGSGSVTTFARADGFFAIPEGREQVDPQEEVEVTLLGRDLEPSDLVVVGSHCVGLDILLRHARGARRPKVIAVGSRGGIEAAAQGACDIAPLHLLDPVTGRWNEPFAPPGCRFLPGYGRAQGLAFRPADGADAPEGAVEERFRRWAREGRRLANRNPGSGTRVLLDALLEVGEERPLRPPGWETGYRSHTAVAAAIAQRRADFGICLEQSARAAGLAFLPWREERYDFLVPEDRWERPGTRAFRDALADPAARADLARAGFLP